MPESEYNSNLNLLTLRLQSSTLAITPHGLPNIYLSFSFFVLVIISLYLIYFCLVQYNQ